MSDINEDKLLNFERKVLGTVNKYKMLTCKETSSVLVGLSGGADSVSLVLALDALKKSGLGIEISCAHVNHMIRGASADADEEFSRRLCLRLGIPFFSERIDIPRLSSERGKGTEETARDERYAFFDRIKRENGIDLTATAHTASDNAETMIFNLARGSALDGLCGIPPKREGIIRPLIFCTRAEVEEYLSLKGQDYVTDETNLADDYSRNIIRHAVMPKLKTINPSIEKTLSESAEILRHDRDCLNRIAEKETENGNARIAEMPVGVAARVVRNAYRDFAGKELSGANLSEILRVAGESLYDKTAKYVSCGGIFAILSRGEVSFVREIETSSDGGFCFEPKHGLNEVSDGRWLVLLGTKEDENVRLLSEYSEHGQNSYKLTLNYSLFSDRINGKIIVRSRRPGDSYVYGGMTRKLKKVFNGMKIPNGVKNTVPVVCDDGGIIVTGLTPVADFHRGNGGDLAIFIYERIDNR